MLRKFLSLTILVMVAGTNSGCFIGTTLNTMGFTDDAVAQLSPFGGTRFDILCASQGLFGGEHERIFWAMDIPLSIVGDAAMLPITVPYTLLNYQRVDPRFQIEKLESSKQAEEPPEIDDEMRQELNDSIDPWNKGPSEEQPELPSAPIE